MRVLFPEIRPVSLDYSWNRNVDSACKFIWHEAGRADIERAFALAIALSERHFDLVKISSRRKLTDENELFIPIGATSEFRGEPFQRGRTDCREDSMVFELPIKL